MYYCVSHARAPPSLYPLSLHDALPILDITDGVLCDSQGRTEDPAIWAIGDVARRRSDDGSARRVEHWTSAGEQGTALARSEEHTSELQSRGHLVCRLLLEKKKRA